MGVRFGALVAGACGLSALAGSVYGEVGTLDNRAGIIQEIAEGLNDDVWTINLNGPDTAVETASGSEHPVRFGESSIRGFIGAGGDNYRAEYNARRVLPDHEYWYGWSLFFGEDIPLDEDHWGTVVTQFKFWPRTGIDGANLPNGGLGTHLWLANAAGGGTVGHPGVPSLRLVHHWEAIDSDVDGDRDIRAKQFLVKADPKLGVWHDFVMNVRWTEHNDGFIKLWHQEEDSGYSLVVDRSGPTVWKNQPEDQGPFFAAGPYSSGSFAARTVYSDEYRLADASSGFEDVRPDKGGAPLIASYADWVAAYLAGYSGEQGFDDDPGEFGVPNFKRYAFALDPLNPVESTLIDGFRTTEDDRFAFSFRRYTGIEDVIHSIETASNLTGPWKTNGPGLFVSDTNEDDGGREEVRITGPLGESDRQFLRVRASPRTVPDGTVFFEDFETYSDGATPSARWLTSAPEDTAAMVQGPIGERYLTMTDVNQEAVTRVIRPFNAEGAESVSVTFDWRRKTDRGYTNHLGESLLHVPALYLLQGATHTNFSGSNIVAHIRFRSWDRGDWMVRNASNDFDSGRVGADDFLHDEPLRVRITYRRSGYVRMEVSKDDFETVEWSFERESFPNLNVNAVAIGSSNAATSGTNRLYADPVWEVRSVLVTSSND